LAVLLLARALLALLLLLLRRLPLVLSASAPLTLDRRAELLPDPFPEAAFALATPPGADDRREPDPDPEDPEDGAGEHADCELDFDAPAFAGFAARGRPRCSAWT
jgi:hypothetical protein